MELGELKIIFNNINKSSSDYDLFIETGSYVGHTLNEVKSEFQKVISIEITEKYSELCKNIFAGFKNVEIIKGDSLIELPKLLQKYIDKRIIFFLDAHYSSGDTGKNNMDTPLIEELKIINKEYKNEGLIIIDDADMFDTNVNECWLGINEKNILDVLKHRVKIHFYTPDVRSESKKRLIIVLR